MEYIVLCIHVFAAIGAIGLILIQQGKGSEAGASFGSGASQTFFGSQGSGNFLTRSTAILITLFFITSLGLGYLASKQVKGTDLDELLKRAQPQSEPKGGVKGEPKGHEGSKGDVNSKSNASLNVSKDHAKSSKGDPASVSGKGNSESRKAPAESQSIQDDEIPNIPASAPPKNEVNKETAK